MMYIFRRRIPLDLVQHYGRKEITKALGTSNRKEADRLGRALSVKYDEEFETARAALEAGLPLQINNKASVPEDKRQIQGANAQPPVAVGDVQGLAYRILIRLREQREQAIAEDRLEQFLAHQRDELEWARSALNGTADMFYEAWKYEAGMIARQQFLEPGRYPPILPPALPPAAQPSTTSSKPGTTLERLAELWEKDKNPRDPKTPMKVRLVVRKFTQHFGPISVEAITRKHCIEFRDALRDDGQSAANINNYLARLSALFSVARDRDIIAQSPATGLALKETGKAVHPFDVPALVKIFTSPVYTEGVRPKAGAGAAAYWLPLLALFTGARIEELAQLHPDDVREETYDDGSGTRVPAWVIRITDAGEGQELKNASSRRMIPVHPDLIRLGFIEYVATCRNRNRIFHELRKDTTGRESGSWSKWFSRWLRGTCKVEDTRMVFHSFRHTFKDLCRDAEIDEPVHDALTGHSGANTVARAYGSGQYPLRPLVLAMQKLRPPADAQRVIDALHNAAM
jgi:integrase